MSNKFIKKTVNILLISLFVVFSALSGTKIYNTYKEANSFKSFDEILSGEEDTESKEDELNVPIDESQLEGAVLSEFDKDFNNKGAKDDIDEPEFKFEILNLEALSKVIPTDGNQLSEVYHSTVIQVRKLINSNTYSYIDESTMVYKDSTLKFTLLNYGNDNKISDVAIKLSINNSDEKTDTIKNFRVENLELLKDYGLGGSDYLVYALETITNEVLKDNSKLKGCSIQKDSISSTENSVSFNVTDLNTKSKIKTITLMR